MKKLSLIALFVCAPAFAQDFTTNGLNGFGGGTYDHVIAAAGYLHNPLSGPSQVGFYAANHCNAYALAHCAGFESAVGTAQNVTVQRMESYTVANVDRGAGSVIVRYKSYAFADDAPGQNNAIFASHDDVAFTGNWFIYYRGGRPTQIDGDIGMGRAPEFVPNSRSFVMEAPVNAFIRIYVNGVESARIQVTANDTYIDNYGAGTLTLRTRGGPAVILNANGSVSIPSLSGGMNKAVYADTNGTLFAK